MNDIFVANLVEEGKLDNYETIVISWLWSPLADLSAGGTILWLIWVGLYIANLWQKLERAVVVVVVVAGGGIVDLLSNFVPEFSNDKIPKSHTSGGLQNMR